ncbi:potassium channel family protein [Brassicibacter mesophilus]|uniref:potassium channel family protein n=1 Tax=Brassicibacter mesophilus TaxID=745119 RepID=UPI003D1EF427
MIDTIKKNKFTLIYEVSIAILALIAVSLAFLDLVGKVSIESTRMLFYIDNCILSIFFIDYFVRLILSQNKKEFFIHNILDLIAIIPFNSLFRAFRIVRLIRVIRLAKLTKLTRLVRFIVYIKKFTNKIEKFIHTNGFIYVLYLTIVTIILGSIGIYYAEQNQTIKSFGDAVWWSFVTATTVGYGDISPVTTVGRVIAAILMVVGIGFIGMLTGTIATYFIGRKDKVNSHLNKNKMINLSDLNEEEFNEVLNFIDFIKSKNS